MKIFRNGTIYSTRYPRIPGNRFKSKFEIDETCAFEIIENDTCDQIAKLLLPDGGNFSKWKLNPVDAKLKPFIF